MRIIQLILLKLMLSLAGMANDISATIDIFVDGKKYDYFESDPSEPGTPVHLKIQLSRQLEQDETLKLSCFNACSIQRINDQEYMVMYSYEQFKKNGESLFVNVAKIKGNDSFMLGSSRVKFSDGEEFIELIIKEPKLSLNQTPYTGKRAIKEGDVLEIDYGIIMDQNGQHASPNFGFLVTETFYLQDNPLTSEILSTLDWTKSSVFKHRFSKEDIEKKVRIYAIIDNEDDYKPASNLADKIDRIDLNFKDFSDFKIGRVEVNVTGSSSAYEFVYNDESNRLVGPSTPIQVDINKTIDVSIYPKNNYQRPLTFKIDGGYNDNTALINDNGHFYNIDLGKWQFPREDHMGDSFMMALPISMLSYKLVDQQETIDERDETFIPIYYNSKNVNEYFKKKRLEKEAEELSPYGKEPLKQKEQRLSQINADLDDCADCNETEYDINTNLSDLSGSCNIAEYQEEIINHVKSFVKIDIKEIGIIPFGRPTCMWHITYNAKENSLMVEQKSISEHDFQKVLEIKNFNIKKFIEILSIESLRQLNL